MKVLLVHLLVACLHVAYGEAPHPTPVVVRNRVLPSKSAALDGRPRLESKRQGSTLVAARAASGAKAGSKSVAKKGETSGNVSFKWAVLHNWLYFLALGLSIPVLARVIATIVNPDGSPDVSPASSVLGGDVEAVDKIITFLCVGFLGALSDVVGRKPLLAYSALGFAITCYLQAQCTSSTAILYLADFVDGISSCMSGVCQAYVIDASPPDRCAVNIGIFQGVSVAGAFIIGFPASAAISAKWGLRAPLYAAAGVGFLNFLIALLLTPESLPPAQREGKKLDLASANPLGALRLLFGRTGLMRGSCAAFFLVWFANACINSQFSNYVNHLLGWGPQESAPLLVLVGIMLAIAPKMLVPRLGLKHSIEVGCLVYGAGLLATAFAKTAPLLVYSVLFSSIGCIAVPALITFIANQAEPAERGALLGGIETLQEACLALAYVTYGRVFAHFISDDAPFKLPGAPFVLASAVMAAAYALIKSTFAKFPDAAAKFF